jgi:2-polyprenyl-3-methyl-5-hydroxy-6-metoxy-1,4-benzoquinol methylase
VIILQPNVTTSSTPHVPAEVSRQRVACDLCGGHESEPFCPENGRGLVRCLNCGLVYVGLQPEAAELYALYGETYFHNNDSGEVGYTNYIKDEHNIRKTFAGRLKRLERWVKPGKVLDVGCAAGFFLDVAQQRGWQVQGMDVSNFAVEYVRQRFGYDARLGSLADLDYPENNYDLITLWDVIEHVPSPKAYVEKIAKLLKSGGVVALATPNVDSPVAKITGKNWMGYKLSEEHVYYFSVKTLRRLLEEAGFEVVDTRHVGKYVTMRLFIDRLEMYLPPLAKLGGLIERVFKLSQRSFYVNPFDIVAITARKK